jgi:flagellar motor switch protein FliN/FliY
MTELAQSAVEAFAANFPVPGEITFDLSRTVSGELTLSAQVHGPEEVRFGVAILAPHLLTIEGQSSLDAATMLTPALRAAGLAVGGLDTTVTEMNGTNEGTATVFEIFVDGVAACQFLVGVSEANTTVDRAHYDPRDVTRLEEVEMEVTVVIGRTRLPVADILSWQPGQVVELDRAVGAPADILINGRLVANGEIVVQDQDFAVRVTRILGQRKNLAA